MDRRQFLKAAPVVTLTPMSANSASATPRTVGELEEYVERMFDSLDGPALSYWEGASWAGDYGRVVYTVLSNGVIKTEGEAVEGAETEESAVVSTWHAFLGFAHGKRGRLYWRTRPELKVASVDDQLSALKQQMNWDGYREVNGLYYPREAIDDGVIDGLSPRKLSDLGTADKDLYYVYMRFAITDRMPFSEVETADRYHVDPDGAVWKRQGRIA